MFARLLYQSFLRQRRRKLLAGAAVALGVAVATAMIAVATDIGDKLNRELRNAGANLVVSSQAEGLSLELGGVSLRPAGDAAYLNEADLPRIKQTFWKNNIVAFAPVLPVTVDVSGSKVELVGTYFDRELTAGAEHFHTGMRATNPWWQVSGDWPPDDSASVLVGETLAQRLQFHAGSTVRLGDTSLHVAGIVNADPATNQQIIAPLAVAQRLLGKPGVVHRVYVSALTKPEDAFARRNPRSLSPADYDRWYCSPYANSIAFQITEAIPGAHAEQIRQVAQNEGAVLGRITGLMLLLVIAALTASALAVSAAMATSIFERRNEIGLMKALGAGKLIIALLFLAEAAVLALLAGSVGFSAGALLAHQMGRTIFDSSIAVAPALLPIVLLIAIIVTFGGSAVSIRRAVRLDPALVLRGDA